MSLPLIPDNLQLIQSDYVERRPDFWHGTQMANDLKVSLHSWDI